MNHNDKCNKNGRNGTGLGSLKKEITEKRHNSKLIPI